MAGQSLPVPGLREPAPSLLRPPSSRRLIRSAVSVAPPEPAPAASVGVAKPRRLTSAAAIAASKGGAPALRRPRAVVGAGQPAPEVAAMVQSGAPARSAAVAPQQQPRAESGRALQPRQRVAPPPPPSFQQPGPAQPGLLKASAKSSVVSAAARPGSAKPLLQLPAGSQGSASVRISKATKPSVPVSEVSAPGDLPAKAAAREPIGKRRPLSGLSNHQVNAAENRRPRPSAAAVGSEDLAAKAPLPSRASVAPPPDRAAKVRRSVEGVPPKPGGAASRHRRSLDKQPAPAANQPADPASQESMDLFEQMMEAALAQGSIKAGAAPRVLLKSPPPRKPRSEYSPIRRRQLLDDERYFVCTKVVHDADEDDPADHRR